MGEEESVLKYDVMMVFYFICESVKQQEDSYQQYETKAATYDFSRLDEDIY